MADAAHALRRLPDPARDPAPTPRPGPAPSEDPGSSRAGGPRHWPLVAALVLGLLVVLAAGGYLLAGAGSDTAGPPSPAPGDGPATPSPSEQAPSGTPSPSRPASPAPGSHQGRRDPTQGSAPSYGKVATVDRDFGAMPGATDVGWTRLTPGMRQRVGRDSYESFWGSVDAVQASGTTPVRGEPAVLTTLTYHMDDGRVVRERERITLQRLGSRYLIADDEVLSSRTVSD